MRAWCAPRRPPTAPPFPRGCGRRCCSSSRCLTTASTSTCTRQRRKCGFGTAGPPNASWSTPFGARSAPDRARRRSAAGALAEPRADPVPVPPLLQVRRTYITFEHDDGMVFIDQHSAHERVLYERFVRTLERGEAPSQRLLFPITLHLGPAEGDAFDEHRALFERLGFEIEGFGGHTLIVSAV